MSVFLVNFSPTGEFVSPDLVVSFDITSDDRPIDINSLDVWWGHNIAADMAIASGQFQDGYYGTISSTVVGGNPGYHVEIIPPSYQYGCRIGIKIQFDTTPPSGIYGPVEYFSTASHLGSVVELFPSFGTLNEEMYPNTFGGSSNTYVSNNILFQQSDISEPVITNRYPAVDSILTSASEPILFGLHDNGNSGVDITTLDMYIDNGLVISNGEIVDANYDGYIVAAIVNGYSGYNISLTPSLEFAYNDYVDIRVVVSDVADGTNPVNTLDTTYSFYITDTASPILIPDMITLVDADLDAYVGFYVLDVGGSTVDINTLNVTFVTDESSTPIVVSGAPQLGYNFNYYPVTVNNNDGFYVVINKYGYFKELETVSVVVNAEDTVGNYFADYFNFVTGDFSEPVIITDYPDASDVNVPIDTDITFYIHDQNASGTDIGSLEVYINGSLAVYDGYDGYINSSEWDGYIAPSTIDGYNGYVVTLSRIVPFDYNYFVPVSIAVNDYYLNPATYDYSFTTAAYSDTTGPTATFTMQPTNVLPTDCITFTWLDEPLGIGADITTLNVVLENSNGQFDAVIGGVVQPGYELSYYATDIDDKVGYNIVVCSSSPWDALETYNVYVSGADMLGNNSSSFFSFEVADIYVPEIVGLNPRPGDIGVDVQQTIQFYIHDNDKSEIDRSSLIVHVNNRLVVYDGYDGYIDSANWDGYVLPATIDGYSAIAVALTPLTPFEFGELITVRIMVSDDAYVQNQVAYDYSFETETLPILELLPTNGAVGIQRDTAITVKIYDASNNVEQSSINVVVAGNQAVLNGAAVYPFDVTIENYYDQENNANGYIYIIDTEIDFGFGEVVSVYASGTNAFGNIISDTISFTTFNDVISPAVSNIYPADNAQSVLVDTNIGFTVRDAYDIDFNTISVTIDGYAVITNGGFEPGYSISWLRVLGDGLGTSPGDGYSFVIDPINDLGAGEDIIVNIFVSDRLGNSTIQSVSWRTFISEPPEFTINMDNINVSIGASIDFEVTNSGLGLDITSLQVTLGETPLIINGALCNSDYPGIIEIPDAYHCVVLINPVMLFNGSSVYTLYFSAKEFDSGLENNTTFIFSTEPNPENPSRLFIGHENGISAINISDLDGYSSAHISSLIDGYNVNSMECAVINNVNRLIAGTSTGAILYTTNYNMPLLAYSKGDVISHVFITENNLGTVYLANLTKERIDVYYNIVYDTNGRDVPDFYYGLDGYVANWLNDGYFTAFVVTENTSTIDAESNSIFIGTPNGVCRIETDESDPGSSELNGVSMTYAYSDADFNIFGGQSNYVTALSVNKELGYLYVATRSDSESMPIALTYINMENNTAVSIPESRIINRNITSLSFKNRK